MVCRGVFLNSMTMTVRKPEIGHGGGSVFFPTRSTIGHTAALRKKQDDVDCWMQAVRAGTRRRGALTTTHTDRFVFVLRRTTTTPIEGRRTHGRGDRRTRVVLGATHVFDGTTRSEIAGER